MQDTHGFRLEYGEIIGLTNAISSSEISSVHGWEAVGYIALPFPADSKIEKYSLLWEDTNVYDMYICLKAHEVGHGEEYDGFGFKSPRSRPTFF